MALIRLIICLILNLFTMSTLELELYDAIKKKLGEKESKLLLQTIESKISKDLDRSKDTLATKSDLANLKADIIKWMFIFWAGTVALSGILKATGII
tara:strand:+ start:13634 stop:13924 length:291 start_codon:yes stop_codon:yes gene_type:complete